MTSYPVLPRSLLERINFPIPIRNVNDVVYVVQQGTEIFTVGRWNWNKLSVEVLDAFKVIGKHESIKKKLLHRFLNFFSYISEATPSKSSSPLVPIDTHPSQQIFSLFLEDNRKTQTQKVNRHFQRFCVSLFMYCLGFAKASNDSHFALL